LSGPKEKLGVVMYDGMTELGLAGIVDPVLGSFSARTYGMAAEHRVIRTLNGLDLLPRYSFDSVPSLDRVVLAPGDSELARQEADVAWTARQPGLSPLDPYRTVGHGESAYDVSFRDLAQTRNRFLAQHMANVLFYPADVAVQVPGAAWPIHEALALIGAMVAGAALVFGATHVQPGRRTRLQAITQPA
jgi:hypothetical protein